MKAGFLGGGRPKVGASAAHPPDRDRGSGGDVDSGGRSGSGGEGGMLAAHPPDRGSAGGEGGSGATGGAQTPADRGISNGGVGGVGGSRPFEMRVFPQPLGRALVATRRIQKGAC